VFFDRKDKKQFLPEKEDMRNWE